MTDERRLAICIKGGVSLGAYEAGVLAKTLELIANNNFIANNIPQAHAIPWYIDTLAGASAGSMTSVATACILLNSSSNYLAEMWVHKAALSTLAPDSSIGTDLGYQKGDDMLAASSLDALAIDFDAPPPLVTKRHPALRPGYAIIRTIFSLSNINGVPNPVDTLNGSSLVFREYADAARFDITVDDAGRLYVSGSDTRAAASIQANDDSGTAWYAMIQSAIASGSFPLAFSPRGLWRWHADRHEYSAEYYSDGGLFDNDPVGKLINLAHETDWAPGNAVYQDNQRRFMVVHTAPTDLSDPSIKAPCPTLELNPIDLARKLIPAFVNESMESGLRGITTVNLQFAQRMSVLNRLAKFAATSSVAPGGPSPLMAAISALATLRGFSDDQINQLRGFLIPDLKDTDPILHDYVIKLPAGAQRVFEDFAIFFDLSFDLADKVPIKPILIAPSPGESLSGDPLFAFAGFFSQTLRECDFARGQYDAFKAWEAISKGPEKDFTIEGVEAPSPVGDRQPDTDAPSSSSEYTKGLEVFRKRLKLVIDRAVDELKSESGLAAKVGLDLLQILANLGVGTIG